MKHAAIRKLSSFSQEAEVASLLDLSMRLGRDPLLVQASNGNISIKLDGVLWIKASGKWLANAKQEETLVPVELAVVKESLRRNVEIAQYLTLGNQLRPSIETAMHAVLQHRVVVHVHSVNTIAWAVRQDGPRQLVKRLAGLSWQWVPYAASGMPLAREIEKLLRGAEETNVFILENHGLVVCGDDCERTEALLREVEERLAINSRTSPAPEAALSAIVSRSPEWRLPNMRTLHALGTDAISCTILRKGILYPCQAIFLGSKMRMLPYSVPLSKFAEYFSREGERQTYMIVEGGGVIVHEAMNDAEYATLVALMQVVQRIEEFARLKYLTLTEIASVLCDRTHAYREAVAAAVEPDGPTRQTLEQHGPSNISDLT